MKPVKQINVVESFPNKKIELDISFISLHKNKIISSDSFRSNSFSVGIILEGEMRMKLDLTEHILNKNTVFFVSPVTVKQFLEIKEDVQLLKIDFTTLLLLQTGMQKHDVETMEYVVSTGIRLLHISRQESARMELLVRDLLHKYRNIDNHPYGEFIVHHTFRIFLYELGALGIKHNIGLNDRVPLKDKISRKQDIVIRFASYLNLHYKKERSVKYYADLLSITPKYLTEVVTEITGNSPSEIIHEKIITETKILLNDPKLSIAQIAEELNFSDQSFLGKYFKRFTGISPTSFRS